MSIYIYRRSNSTGARELAQAVGGARWRRQAPPQIVAGDTVVCWGESAPPGLLPGVRVVNGAPIRNKFEDAQILARAGVATVAVSRVRPPATPAAPARPQVDPALALWEEAQDACSDFCEIATLTRTPVMVRGLQDLGGVIERLRTAINLPFNIAPAGPAVEWLPRTFAHSGGEDLLTPPATPEYFSRKETFTTEYRVHSFNGLSIRAGRKVPRDGVLQHPWIRSFDGGWRINYDNFESTRPMRELAAAACTALNLQFGAVDIGQKADGTLVVLEVNRAPGLEGGTVAAYANNVTRIAQGG